MINRLNLLILIALLAAGCSSDPLDVDVSGIEVDIAFERFDEAMFAATSPAEMKKINDDLIKRGGELYEFYVYDMLRAGSVYDDSVGNYLYYFVTDSIMKMTADDIKAVFGDFSEQQDAITDAFKHLKYHLPDAKVPEKIITWNSAFNYGMVPTETSIGIGLEMYLGFDNRIVKQLPFPQFMKLKMSKDYLLVDLVRSWLEENVLGEDSGETFLSAMIYYGKLYYAADAMLPDMEDYYKIRYTEMEWEWALASEYDIWQFLVNEEYIYSTDAKAMLRYFEEAPTTVDMEGSPGRIGQFMGWQIVKMYMEKNPDVTLQQLLDETNEGKILKAYKPEPDEES